MTKDLAQALDKLEATRAALRVHLLSHAEHRVADGDAPETTTGHRVRMIGKAIEKMWQGSTVSHTLEIARPIVVQAIRENPYVALTLSVGLGALLGLSRSVRHGTARTVGNLAWKSVDAATLLTLLWEIYGQSGKTAPEPVPENPAPEDPAPQGWA